VRQEFVGDRARVDPAGHEVVAAVTQHADNLGRQRFVEQSQHGPALGTVAGRDRTILGVAAGPLAQKRRVEAGAPPLLLQMAVLWGQAATAVPEQP
jgi:hypothetical protein